jgi:hypothetical protein
MQLITSASNDGESNVAEMHIHSILTGLITQEDFIAFSHRESFKSYMLRTILWDCVGDSVNID